MDWKKILSPSRQVAKNAKRYRSLPHLADWRYPHGWSNPVLSAPLWRQCGHERTRSTAISKLDTRIQILARGDVRGAGAHALPEEPLVRRNAARPRYSGRWVRAGDRGGSGRGISSRAAGRQSGPGYDVTE